MTVGFKGEHLWANKVLLSSRASRRGGWVHMAQEEKKKGGSLCKYTQYGLFNLIIVLYIHVYTCVQYYWIKAGLVVHGNYSKHDCQF